jgi:MoaA/NifB/PqqE/SkfB family radical SAM enzyme
LYRRRLGPKGIWFGVLALLTIALYVGVGCMLSNDKKYFFDQNTCRFAAKSQEAVQEVAKSLERPLSVILQITRRCQLSCIFCSETEHIADITVSQTNEVCTNLTKVPRVFLSGGEPLLHPNFREIVTLFADKYITGLATNAWGISDYLDTLKQKISFLNIGLDGPRGISEKVRGGNYDKTIRGIVSAYIKGIPISITCVLLRSTLESLLFACQIGEAYGARKIKLVHPVRKGNALTLSESEYVSEEACLGYLDKIKILKKKYSWRAKIIYTPWNSNTEGYSLLMYPNGETYAWPVFDRSDKVLRLGNLFKQPVEEIWKVYPYKENHVKKYLGDSIIEI